MSFPDSKSPGPADPLLPYGEPRIAFVVMLSVFGLGNLLFFPVTMAGPSAETFVPIAGWFGALLAEVGLVAMFGVLAPVRTLARLGGAVTLAAVLTGTLVLGLAVASLGHADGITPEAAAIVLGSVLLILPFVVSAQVPIWIARWSLGWQVANFEQAQTLARPTQFTIAHLMGATTFVAVLIALTQQAAWLVHAPPQEFWPVLLVYWLATVVLSAFTTLPALYAVLHLRHAGFGFVGMLCYALFAFLGISAFLSVMAGPGTGEVLAVLAVFFSGLVLSLTLPLLFMRACGYRLVTRTMTRDEALEYYFHQKA